jgi:undecaprenyl diphosphate synthase
MQHLAMVMDGNRRWAKERKLEAVTQGHRKGADAAKTAIEFCLKKGIRYLSLYTFSLENFRRNDAEKNYLFNLLKNFMQKYLPDFIKQEVQIRFVGDRSMFPESIRKTIETIERETRDLSKLQVNFLFCYGSIQELVQAAKSIAKKVEDGQLSSDEIDETIFRKSMWLGDVPDPEIIVRTGKVSRLSNFLLFQGAYSEWFFLDCYWPEIDEKKLEECVERFGQVQRNFGH